MQMRIPCGGTLPSEFSVFSSPEYLFQSIPPVSAVDISRAKGFCLGELRHSLAGHLQVVPREEKGEDETAEGSFGLSG